MPRTVVILQSRTSSKRLPGKVLKKINKIPIVILCAKRLSNKGHQVIVATSFDKTDDKLVKILIKNKIKYFRGNLKDVFSRYLQIAKNYKPSDLIVRATADNVFPDGELINIIRKEMIRRKTDYLGINPNLHLLPKGISLEIFTVKKILNTAKYKLNKNHLEHVTLKMYEKNKKYHFYLIAKLKQKSDLSNIRLTIDTKKDYHFVKNIFKKIDNPFKISCLQLIKKVNRQFL